MASLVTKVAGKLANQKPLAENEKKVEKLTDGKLKTRNLIKSKFMSKQGVEKMRTRRAAEYAQKQKAIMGEQDQRRISSLELQENEDEMKAVGTNLEQFNELWNAYIGQDKQIKNLKSLHTQLEEIDTALSQHRTQQSDKSYETLSKILSKLKDRYSYLIRLQTLIEVAQKRKGDNPLEKSYGQRIKRYVEMYDKAIAHIGKKQNKFEPLNAAIQALQRSGIDSNVTQPVGEKEEPQGAASSNARKYLSRKSKSQSKIQSKSKTKPKSNTKSQTKPKTKPKPKQQHRHKQQPKSVKSVKSKCYIMKGRKVVKVSEKVYKRKARSYNIPL